MMFDALMQFLDKFKTARNYNSKEIRLTLQEAELMSIDISRLLISQAELSDKVINLQTQLMNGIEVAQDGGKF